MKKHNLLYTPNRADCHAAAVLLKDSYPKPWEVWLAFRAKLLSLWLSERGSLDCHYCGAKNLDMNSKVSTRLATLDHVKPRALGVDEYDVSNLVVACRKCNQSKGDKYED